MSKLGWDDWKTHRLPAWWMIPPTLIAPLIATHLPAQHWQNSLVGMFIYSILFLFIYFMAKKIYGTAALGLGDVFLAGLLGCWGGILWGGWAIALGMICGAIGGLIGWMLGRWHIRTSIPYGTFLLSGGILISFWLLIQELLS